MTTNYKTLVTTLREEVNNMDKHDYRMHALLKGVVMSTSYGRRRKLVEHVSVQTIYSEIDERIMYLLELSLIEKDYERFHRLLQVKEAVRSGIRKIQRGCI